MRLRTLFELLNNERGTIWVTLSIMVIPLAMLTAAALLDLSRAMWVKSQLQTAVDAGALAGALTAEAIPETEIEIRYYSDGSVKEVIEKIVGWHAEINDPVKACNDAQAAVTRNTLLLSPAQGGFTSHEEFKLQNMTSQLIGEDSYMVNAHAKVHTFLLSKAMLFYGYNGHDALTARVMGIAKAYPVPE